MNMIKSILKRGYKRNKSITGILGNSELLLYTHNAGKKVKGIYINSRNTYAYAITTDNSIIDGCFYYFPKMKIINLS